MENKVKELMSIMFAIDADTINESSTMENTKGWDSLSNMNLMLSLEQEYSIKLTDAEINSVSSFNDVIELLQKKTN